MKTLKELYTILYNEIKDKTVVPGLCGRILVLNYVSLITDDEYTVLSKHFKSQRDLHPEFMTPERNWNDGKHLSLIYWWTTDEDWNPVNRITFVKKLMDTAE